MKSGLKRRIAKARHNACEYEAESIRVGSSGASVRLLKIALKERRECKVLIKAFDRRPVKAN